MVDAPTPTAPLSALALAKFCASSRFLVRNDMDAAVRQAFELRPHLVDTAPGFCRMEVMQPREDPKEFWLMTWWTDEAAFTAWHRGHDYHCAHAGIPKGLKLVAGSVQIRHLEVLCE